MSTPPSPEQRLEVSRALCLQALRQPAWLLLVQRMCVKPTHSASNAHGDTPEKSLAETLLSQCVKAFLDQLDDKHIRQGQNDHAQHQGPR
jgi:hypothetical protein